MCTTKLRERVMQTRTQPSKLALSRQRSHVRFGMPAQILTANLRVREL